jgi:hypothetical protein
VGKAQPDQQFRVRPVAQHVRPAAGRLEAQHRRLEMAARRGQVPGPVGGDSLDVAALHPQDLVAVALGAGPQPLTELARRLPVAARERGHRERPDQRRFRVAAELASEAQGACVHPFHPLRPVALAAQQRRRQRGEQPELEPGGIRAGRQPV